jgi:hypothetical protein
MSLSTELASTLMLLNQSGSHVSSLSRPSKTLPHSQMHMGKQPNAFACVYIPFQPLLQFRRCDCNDRHVHIHRHPNTNCKAQAMDPRCSLLHRLLFLRWTLLGCRSSQSTARSMGSTYARLSFVCRSLLRRLLRLLNGLYFNLRTILMIFWTWARVRILCPRFPQRLLILSRNIGP